jgi:hypothetical protein
MSITFEFTSTDDNKLYTGVESKNITMKGLMNDKK